MKSLLWKVSILDNMRHNSFCHAVNIIMYECVCYTAGYRPTGLTSGCLSLWINRITTNGNRLFAQISRNWVWKEVKSSARLVIFETFPHITCYSLQKSIFLSVTNCNNFSLELVTASVTFIISRKFCNHTAMMKPNFTLVEGWRGEIWKTITNL